MHGLEGFVRVEIAGIIMIISRILDERGDEVRG
jgi:hypothetical protein